MNEKKKNEKLAPDALVEAVKEAIFNVKKHGTVDLNDSVRLWLQKAESALAAHEKAVPKQPDALTTIAGIILKDFSGRLPQNIVERLEAALPAEVKS